jgi:hypothetical protein
LNEKKISGVERRKIQDLDVEENGENNHFVSLACTVRDELDPN